MKRLEQYRKNMRMLSNPDEQRNRTACAIAFAVAAVVLAILIASAACGAGERTPRYMKAIATGYCSGPCDICGTTGVTHTGRNAHSKGVAVDHRMIGARFDVPGYGVWVRADDTGNPKYIKDNHIDLRFLTHSEASAYGKREITVRIWE
jgi:3D (Asp-Asp-Asp) domain-containing protein